MSIAYIFIYRMIRSGGTENLMLKLALKIRQRSNAEVRCACEECSDEFHRLFDGCNIPVDEIAWENYEEYCKAVAVGKEIRIITFEWDTFICFFRSKRKCKKTLLYAVHPECIKGQELIEEANKYHKDLRIYEKEAVASFIDRMANSTHMLVMDEIVQKGTEKFFNRTFNLRILRICVDLADDWDVMQEQIHRRFAGKVLFTAARAEFPFKGYILGLLKWMRTFDNEAIVLKIVSYGDAYDEIKNEWRNLPKKIKKAQSQILCDG